MLPAGRRGRRLWRRSAGGRQRGSARAPHSESPGLPARPPSRAPRAQRRPHRQPPVCGTTRSALPISRPRVVSPPLARPVTLFTGQWADLPLETLAEKAASWGFDGLELACWGDHFEVDRALAEADYVRSRRELLDRHGLLCLAIGAHLVGQAVCDRIDERHQAILPPDVWGDGDPEAVRQRAAQRMIDTAYAAREFFDLRPRSDARNLPAVVNGFTGSSIWHALYAFPPTSQEYLQRG